MNTKLVFEKEEVKLKSADGTEKVFIMRPFKEGDETGIIECVREEYGDSYFKTDFYDPEKVKEDALSDRYRFFVAETDGKIAGMEIFHLFSEDEDYIEPASQILKKEYRNYGLSGALVFYTLPLAEKMEPCALFVHAVTFHKATQTVCEAYGMTPVGFRLGSFLTEKMNNSYIRQACDKYSEGIMIRAVRKKDAGTIYIPEEIRDYTDKIYGRLKVKYNIADSTVAVDITSQIPNHAVLSIKRDEVQRLIMIKVDEPGKDLVTQMRDLKKSFGNEPYWVIQIMLNTDTPVIYDQYEELKSEGFFFSGLKPLCGSHERMYMQWIGNTELHMDKYVLTQSFEEIRRDIERMIP